LSYNYEIWFADRHLPSEERYVGQSETGCKIAPQRPSSWKSIYNIITLPKMVRCGWDSTAWCWMTCALQWYGRNQNRQ